MDMLEVFQIGVVVFEYVIQAAQYKVLLEHLEVVVHQPLEYPWGS